MGFRLSDYNNKDIIEDRDNVNLEDYTPKKFRWDEEEGEVLTTYVENSNRIMELDNIRYDERIGLLLEQFMKLGYHLSIGMVDNKFTIILLNTETRQEEENFTLDTKDSIVEDVTLRVIRDPRIQKYLQK